MKRDIGSSLLLLGLLGLCVASGCESSPTEPSPIRPEGKIQLLRDLDHVGTGALRGMVVGGGYVAWWEDPPGGDEPKSLRVIDVDSEREWSPVTEQFPAQTVLTEDHVYWTATDSATSVTSLHRVRLGYNDAVGIETLAERTSCPLVGTAEFVAWCDSSGALVVRDVDLGATKVFENIHLHGSIRSSGTRIIWEANDQIPGSWRILDVKTGLTRRVTRLVGSDVWSLGGVVGTRLAWQEWFPGAGTYNIIVHDLDTDTEIFRQQIDHPVKLHVSKRWMAWIRDEAGERRIMVHRWDTDTTDTIRAQNENVFTIRDLHVGNSMLVWIEDLENATYDELWALLAGAPTVR